MKKFVLFEGGLIPRPLGRFNSFANDGGVAGPQYKMRKVRRTFSSRTKIPRCLRRGSSLGMLIAAVMSAIMMLGACDFLEKDEKSCDDQNNCSAANNQYYCGKNGCAANYGNRCNCD